MKILKTMFFVSLLVAFSAGSSAVDMGKPTGTGKLTVTNISIGSEGTTLDFEGPVENYGTVFATHYLQSVDGDRTRGTIIGEARAMLEDGSMVMTPHNGTFTRSGTSIQIYFTDATSTGVVNFVVWVSIRMDRVVLRQSLYITTSTSSRISKYNGTIYESSYKNT